MNHLKFAMPAIISAIALLSAAPAMAADPVKPMEGYQTSVPKGEKSTPNQDKATMPSHSDTTRAEVKAGVVAARKDGELTPAGEKLAPSKKDMKKQSNTTRAEVKADSAEAKKDGVAVKAGEASTPKQAKGQSQSQTK